jgi:ABC-type transport system involved in cytochrome c biogenesis permease subunit
MDDRLMIFSLTFHSLAFILLVSKRNRLMNIGKVLAASGFALQTAALIIRWLVSRSEGFGHAPMANLYESLIVLSWCFGLIAQIYLWIRKSINAVVFACPFIVIILAYACFSPGIDSSIKPLVPALKSNWLLIHVLTCMAGYAALALGSAIIIYQAAIGNRISAMKSGIARQFIVSGFTIFSFGIMTGAVWAQTAWGRYWGWDPKETWALITWLVYAALLHTGNRAGAKGFLYAGLALIGLACILFTYFGVNYLPGLHGYF